MLTRTACCLASLLLQYGDAAFKRMLSSVVDTDCWEEARESAAEQRKGLTKQQAVAEGVMQSLSAAVGRLQLDLLRTQQQEQGWGQQTQAQKVSRDCRQDRQGAQLEAETSAAVTAFCGIAH
jgi:hypothetical protein